MNLFTRRLAPVLLAAAALAAGPLHAQCVSLNAVDVASVQDFDTLATTGTSNELVLPGWQLREVGTATRVDQLYAADTGSGNAGDTYSFGASGSSDRALGSLRSGTLASTYGACYSNNTGAPINALQLAYTGEQWRLGTIARADTLQFAYSLDATDLVDGSWTGVAALDFSSPSTVAPTGARDGNDAANRTALSATVDALDIAQGATFWIRWTDLDASGADDALAIDDVSVTAIGAGGGGDPVLTVSDTAAAEGDSGTTPFFFTFSLSAPAPAGGVAVTYATADGTAIAGEDYVARGPTTVTIAGGTSSTTITIDVIGDTVAEPNETFFVDISAATGAIVGNARATGTISNDDFTLLPIGQIQGSGNVSPLLGQLVTARGVVTGRKNNGFYFQTVDGDDDGNEATSEALFVFTAGAPPATAEVGNLVLVTGTVAEFAPAADPGQLSLTQLTFAEVTLLTIDNPLPAPVVLTTTFPDPAGPLDQLERVEGMRVTAPSFTVVAPTRGNTSEPNATSTGNGIFNVVVTGTPRPFREPGIRAPDMPPSGSIPPIPRFDDNPELLTVTSAAGGAPALDVAAGATLVGLVGPLDYGFRRYTVLPQPGAVATVSNVPVPTPARLPVPDEFTVATYNLERFFDTVNDPATGDPVLTPAALERRLAKASLAIRDFLHAPDVLGTVEVENLAVLQQLAARVNADAVAAGGPDPGYVAYLEEGNDVGGIDVGFLVRTGEVRPGVARVQVLSVVQQGADTMWTEPGGDTSLLNDRPPLQLDAVVHFADGRAFPVTAIVVHSRSLSGAEAATTNGERIRAKRQRQAEYLATLVQELQAADPDRAITVTGDFNAFEFNDGYVDALGTITGMPSADEATVVPGDGVDLVDPDLLNLYLLEPADQRYSFVFDGSAQSLDHVLVNQALGAAVADIGLDHARINADFPLVARNDGTSPSRLSDHDPVMAYFRLDALAFADLGVVAEALASSVDVGGQLAYAVTLANAGPDAATFAGIGFALDAVVTDMTVAAPVGWTCDAPTVAAGTTTVACTTGSLVNGVDAAFNVTATAPASAAGTVVSLAAAATSQTQDPETDDNADTAAVSVDASADLAVAISGPAALARGAAGSYAITVGNAGPSAAPSTVMAIDAGIAVANASLVAPAGWTCVRIPSGSYRADCTADGAFADAASATITLQVSTAGKLVGTGFTVRASARSAANDPDAGDNAASLAVQVNRTR